MTKFCKDCNHFSGNWNHIAPPPPEWLPLCYAVVKDTNLVTGSNNYFACITMRKFNRCGPEAKLFKPLPPTIFQRIKNEIATYF